MFIVCIYAIPFIIFLIKHSNIAINFTWLLTILYFIQHARACSYSRRRRIRHIRFVVFRISGRAHNMHTSYYNAAVNYIINVISVFFLSLGSGRKWNGVHRATDVWLFIVVFRHVVEDTLNLDLPLKNF